MKMFDLSGKTAVVTGGNGGIGLAMARGMAEAGANIVVAGRNEEKNAKAVSDLTDTGASATSFVLDVTDETACTEMMEFAIKSFYDFFRCCFYI